MTSSSAAYHHLHHLLPITYTSTPPSPITVTVNLHDRALSPSNNELQQLQYPRLLAYPSYHQHLHSPIAVFTSLTLLHVPSSIATAIATTSVHHPPPLVPSPSITTQRHPYLRQKK